jgi:hypothetical protein
VVLFLNLLVFALCMICRAKQAFMLSAFKHDHKIMNDTALIFVLKNTNCVAGASLTALLFALDRASLEPS